MKVTVFLEEKQPLMRMERSEGMADVIRGHLRKGLVAAGIHCHFVLKRLYKKRSTSRRKNTPFARLVNCMLHIM